MSFSLSFFFDDPATTEIYTLSLHDALPIFAGRDSGRRHEPARPDGHLGGRLAARRASDPHRQPVRRSCFRARDRKSTRLNSSHGYISYAVFCLKKKKKKKKTNK